MVDEFENPEYWCGEIGYRPPGYGDFIINSIKEMAILLKAPMSILDIGCAYGYSVRRFNSLGIPSIGIDISNYALSKADEKTRPHLIQGEVWDMPFEDGVFDLAFSSGMMEHVPKNKLKKSISEITRVCKRGLIGIAVTDDVTTLKDEDETHEIITSLEEWRKMFPEEFEIISDSQNSWRIYAILSMRRLIYA